MSVRQGLPGMTKARVQRRNLNLRLLADARSESIERIGRVIVTRVSDPFALIEFPADDPDRARRFWSALLALELDERSPAQGRGWQAQDGDTAIGIHERGRGPGDTASLPYFTVADLDGALEKVGALGGTVIHPGAQWAVCRDSEGSPFGLALQASAQ